MSVSGVRPLSHRSGRFQLPFGSSKRYNYVRCSWEVSPADSRFNSRASKTTLFVSPSPSSFPLNVEYSRCVYSRQYSHSVGVTHIEISTYVVRVMPLHQASPSAWNVQLCISIEDIVRLEPISSIDEVVVIARYRYARAQIIEHSESHTLMSKYSNCSSRERFLFARSSDR